MFELNTEKLFGELVSHHESIGEYTLRQEILSSEKVKSAPNDSDVYEQERKRIFSKMGQSLTIMEQSVTEGRETPIFSVSGISGGNAWCYNNYLKKGTSILGPIVSNAAAMALSCSEVNASMRRIVACPTAGSCGIVPAAVVASAQGRDIKIENRVLSLFTAAGIGIIIGSRATLSGAEGGCQAECGSAAAMAAAAVVEMLGGSPEQAFHAAAMTIKNVLGLVCDPVAGLVEIPCVKRNAGGVVNALLCADLALGGVKSYIPFDEVIDAMYAVGKSIPEYLREKAQGGLAVTPTGRRLAKEVHGKRRDTGNTDRDKQ